MADWAVSLPFMNEIYKILQDKQNSSSASGEHAPGHFFSEGEASLTNHSQGPTSGIQWKRAQIP